MNAPRQEERRPRVAVIDDDTDSLEALEWLLSDSGFEVAAFASASAFLDEEPAEFDVLLSDMRMPGISGLELLEALDARRSALPVILVSGHADFRSVVKAMKAGACDFLQKPYNEQELIDALNQGARNSARRRAREAECADVRARHAGLSDRERELFDLTLAGKANKQVAAELDISTKTVEVHKLNMMRKMGASSVVQLVRLAMRCGLDPETGPGGPLSPPSG